MKQTIFTITENTALTATVYKMVLAGDTDGITTGQFVNILLDGLYLRRPISVCDYDAENLTIVYKVVGKGTAAFLKQNGIRTHALAKVSEGSEEIPNALRQGHIAYFINTKDPGAGSEGDGVVLRQVATEYNVTMFTSLDTVKALLDVLEETTLTISTIDA